MQHTKNATQSCLNFSCARFEKVLVVKYSQLMVHVSVTTLMLAAAFLIKADSVLHMAGVAQQCDWQGTEGLGS